MRCTVTHPLRFRPKLRNVFIIQRKRNSSHNYYRFVTEHRLKLERFRIWNSYPLRSIIFCYPSREHCFVNFRCIKTRIAFVYVGIHFAFRWFGLHIAVISFARNQLHGQWPRIRFNVRLVGIGGIDDQRNACRVCEIDLSVSGVLNDALGSNSRRQRLYVPTRRLSILATANAETNAAISNSSS